MRNSPEVGSYLYISATMNIIAFLMIVRIQNSIPQVKVTSSTTLQHRKDQSVDQRNYLPGQYIYCPGSFPGNIYIFPWLQGNIRNIALHWPLICPRKRCIYIYIIISPKFYLYVVNSSYIICILCILPQFE